MTTLADLTRAHENDTRARAFAFYAKSLAAGDHEYVRTASGSLAPLMKAAVDALTTGNTSSLQRASRPFLDLVERQTVLGRLGALSAPPYVPIPTLTDEPQAGWVGEGAPMPLAQLSFDDGRLGLSKFGLLVAFSKELVESLDERATTVVQRILVRAMRRSEDRLLLSSDAGVPMQQPAGLLYNVSATGAGSPDSLSEDLEALWTSVEYGDPDKPVYVASKRGGQFLAALHRDGAPLFPAAGPLGGSIHGVPLLTTQAAGNKLILIDAGKLVVADDGLVIDRSTEAALQMSDSPSGGAQQLVSLFQANAAAVRLTRWIDWRLLGDDAIGYIELPINGSPA